MASKVYVKNKLIYGVGINDADYSVWPYENGKRIGCPFYRKWFAMLNRCYDHRHHHRFPSYAGTVVCDEWLRFMRFRDWMSKEDWIGKQLDKDLLGTGKLYSPETCVFISQEINCFVLDGNARRGSYPIGVSLDNDRCTFLARTSIGKSRGKNLGRFATPELAHQAWAKAKIELCEQHIQNESNPKIVLGLQRYAEKIRNGYYLNNKNEVESSS